MNVTDERDHDAGIAALVEQFRRDRWVAEEEPPDPLVDLWRTQAELYVSVYMLGVAESRLERTVGDDLLDESAYLKEKGCD